MSHGSKQPIFTAGIVIAVLCSPVARADAGGLSVNVVDRDGNPVEEVAVYAVATSPAVATNPALAPRDSRGAPQAVMDQRNREFVPHVLIVEKGTEITFPNSDSVSHHVYSFSSALAFELPLYKQGTIHPPLRFDTPGIVTLGCNIHDAMVGYIVVVDTPHFATTNSDGAARLDLPAGTYDVQVWTPRLPSAKLPDGARIAVDPQRTSVHTVRLGGRLLPAHAGGSSSLSWREY
jgi:plastocyanin